MKAGLSALWIVMVIATPLAFGQGFEVASVKPAEPGNALSISRSGNRLLVQNATLQFLVTWAYDVRNDRLFGKPGWLDSVRYDVTAKAPEGKLAPGQLQQMMQSLLADRFKLVVHRETRQLPLYSMVVDKSGPKIQISEATGSMGQNPFSMTRAGRLSGTNVTAAMLGFRLEAKKAPVEVIVIDSMESLPTAN